jgi:hypothetical protein
MVQRPIAAHTESTTLEYRPLSSFLIDVDCAARKTACGKLNLKTTTAPPSSLSYSFARLEYNPNRLFQLLGLRLTTDIVLKNFPADLGP